MNDKFRIIFLFPALLVFSPPAWVFSKFFVTAMTDKIVSHTVQRSLREVIDDIKFKLAIHTNDHRHYASPKPLKGNGDPVLDQSFQDKKIGSSSVRVSCYHQPSLKDDDSSDDLRGIIEHDFSVFTPMTPVAECECNAILTPIIMNPFDELCGLDDPWKSILHGRLCCEARP